MRDHASLYCDILIGTSCLCPPSVPSSMSILSKQVYHTYDIMSQTLVPL